jgi:hypothetical protein
MIIKGRGQKNISKFLKNTSCEICRWFKADLDFIFYKQNIYFGWDGMNWIDLAQNRDQWRALVNTVMNLRVP